MEVVNPFILKNKERMIVFLDQLSSIPDPNPPPGIYLESNSNHKCSDAGKIILNQRISLGINNCNVKYFDCRT